MTTSLHETSASCRFVTVAKKLRFRRAVERLHVAQLAVIEQLRTLEAELGVPLLTRDQRTVVLTPSNAALLDGARHVVRLTAEVRRWARYAAAATTARLRVGWATHVLPEAIVHALGWFARERPEIELLTEQFNPRAAVEGVCCWPIDVAVIVCLAAALVDLTATPTGVEEVVAASRDAFPGATGVLPLSQLADTASVVLPREANPRFYDDLLYAARRADFLAPFAEVRDPRVECAPLTAASRRALALLPSFLAESCRLSWMRFVAVAHPATPPTVAAANRSTVEDIHVQRLIQMAVAHATQAEPAELSRTTVDRAA